MCDGDTSEGETHAKEWAGMFWAKVSRADPTRDREAAKVPFQFVNDKDDGSLGLDKVAAW